MAPICTPRTVAAAAADAWVMPRRTGIAAEATSTDVNSRRVYLTI